MDHVNQSILLLHLLIIDNPNPVVVGHRGWDWTRLGGDHGLMGFPIGLTSVTCNLTGLALLPDVSLHYPVENNCLTQPVDMVTDPLHLIRGWHRYTVAPTPDP